MRKLAAVPEPEMPECFRHEPRTLTLAQSHLQRLT